VQQCHFHCESFFFWTKVRARAMCTEERPADWDAEKGRMAIVCSKAMLSLNTVIFPSSVSCSLHRVTHIPQTERVLRCSILKPPCYNSCCVPLHLQGPHLCPCTSPLALYFRNSVREVQSNPCSQSFCVGQRERTQASLKPVEWDTRPTDSGLGWRLLAVTP
jgi:hypothetical protein